MKLIAAISLAVVATAIHQKGTAVSNQIQASLAQLEKEDCSLKPPMMRGMCEHMQKMAADALDSNNDSVDDEEVPSTPVDTDNQEEEQKAEPIKEESQEQKKEQKKEAATKEAEAENAAPKKKATEDENTSLAQSAAPTCEHF